MEEQALMQANLEINKEKGHVLVSVNPKIYPVDVVMSSAYVFTENCYVLVDGDPSEEIIVELKPKNYTTDLEKIGRDFNNELINYANYPVQAIKNAKLREVILNRVLLTNSVDSFESQDCSCENISENHSNFEQNPDDDIPKPWEEENKDNDVNEFEEIDDDESWNFEDPEEIAKPWEEKYGTDKDKQD